MATAVTRDIEIEGGRPCPVGPRACEWEHTGEDSVEQTVAQELSGAPEYGDKP